LKKFTELNNTKNTELYDKNTIMLRVTRGSNTTFIYYMELI